MILNNAYYDRKILSKKTSPSNKPLINEKVNKLNGDIEGIMCALV